MTLPTARTGFALSLAVLLGLAAACEPGATAPDVIDPAAAAQGTAQGKGMNKGGSTDSVVVASVDPDSAFQGQTLDILIRGKNFDAGSQVSFALAGVSTTQIIANSIAFLNARRLSANITVKDKATVTKFDVVVTTGRGRRGIGNELLEVLAKRIPDFSVDMSLVEGELDFSDQRKGILRAAITSDGLGPYSATMNFNSLDLNGRVFLATSPPGKRPKAKSPRAMCLDFSIPGNIRLAAGESLSWNLEFLCMSDTGFHTSERPASEGGDLGGAFVAMAPGDVDVQGGKFALHVKQERWRLLTDPGRVGGSPGFCDGVVDADRVPLLDESMHARGESMRIERLPDTAAGERQWMVESRADAAGRFSAMLLRDDKMSVTCVAKLENFPFRMVVTERL